MGAEDPAAGPRRCRRCQRARRRAGPRPALARGCPRVQAQPSRAGAGAAASGLVQAWAWQDAQGFTLGCVLTGYNTPLAPQKADLPPRQKPEHQLLTAQAAGPQDHGPLAPWPFAARCSSHLSALQAEGESSDGQRAPSSQPGQPFTELTRGRQGMALSPQRPSSRDRPGHTKDCTQDPWHPLSFREGCRPSPSLSGPASHLHLPQGRGGHWVSGASSAEGTGANSDPTF